MIQYICKYSPRELYEGFGSRAEIPNGELEDFSYADSLIHPNVCTHAKQLLTEARGADELLLVNCCDSVRRVCDTLVITDPPAYLEMLDLPHESGGCMVDSYALQLAHAKEAYAAYSGKAFSRERFLRAWKKSAQEWQDKMETMHGPFLILMGARAGDELVASIRDTLRLSLFDMTCTGLRNLTPPPDLAEEMEERTLLWEYAAALLGQIPCMRMKETGPRNWLPEMPGLAGIIYNTVRFCDYYEFEYASVRGKTEVPVLKIETDYTSGTRGQLSTRLTAFAERIGGAAAEAVEKGTAPASRMREGGTAVCREGSPMTDIFIGIDSGSTTTNVVAIDAQGEILASAVVRTGAKSGLAAERALAGIEEKLGKKREEFAHICATGYGREYISFADSRKTEITCHARGAFFLDPKVRTIVDIGGQDSKVICLDQDGNVVNFVMNDKCAAGTGRFLEMMARTLEMELPEMAELGKQWKKDLTISSTCTVFAESEVISLIAENRNTADIIHGLNKAVASKTAAMVKRAQGKPPYMMTGGVARNGSLAKELEERLGSPLFIHEFPDLAGAVGAALFARDAAGKESSL